MVDSYAQQRERALYAILSGDVAGYSRLIAEDEDATIAALDAAREAIGPLITAHGGRLADFTGDNFLAEFPGARDAVACALAIQRALGEQNAARPEQRRLRFRIGAHLGDVRHEGGRLYGDGVNIAARLQPLAEPGGLCLSAAMAELVRGKLEIALEDLGEQTLKNIPQPVRAYRGRPTASGEGHTKLRRFLGWLRLRTRARRRRAVAAALFALVAVAVAIWMSLRGTIAAPSASAPVRFGIAVLPIATIGSDTESRALADGLTEQITHTLSQNGFPVVARTTAALYRDRAADLRELGAALGVSHALEGSVQHASGRVRVTMQLIDTDSGMHVWSEAFEQAAGDPFAIQDKVTDRVAFQVFQTVWQDAVAMRRYSELAGLSELVVEARRLAIEVGKEDQALAVSARLLSVMPEGEPFTRLRGDTHAQMAITLVDLYLAGARSLADASPEFLRHAELAVEIAPDSAFAHHALARTLTPLWQWERAEQAAKRACELAPGDGNMCGAITAHVCAALGCLEEQLAGALLYRDQQAENGMSWWLLAFSLRDNHRLQEAEAAALRARELAEVFGALVPAIQWQLGKRDEAVESLRRIVAAVGSPELAGEIERARAGGPEAAWRWFAEQIGGGGAQLGAIPENDFTAALLYAQLGDTEAALSALERSVAEREGHMENGWTNSALDGIRDTQRFRALLEQMGLTPYYEKYLARERARRGSPG